MAMIKRLLRKALLGYKASSEDYLNYLRSKGAKIGRGGYTFTLRITPILMSSFRGCLK